MTFARVRRLMGLSRRQWSELVLACAWQVRLRLALLRSHGAVDRLAAIANRRRRVVPAPLDPADVERLARWSGVICGGSCLTSAFVHSMLAARHGGRQPVTIGVARDGDDLRAHAWTGDAERDGPFAALWTDARRPRR